MIRGYFSLRSGRKRPFITASLEFPSARRPNRHIVTDFLVDTGADRTILSPRDAEKLHGLGIEVEGLAIGPASTGIGGSVRTRVIDAIFNLDSSAFPLTIAILDATAGLGRSHIPSIIGRDILDQFALFVEQRSDRILLLDANEADALAL